MEEAWNRYAFCVKWVWDLGLWSLNWTTGIMIQKNCTKIWFQTEMGWRKEDACSMYMYICPGEFIFLLVLSSSWELHRSLLDTVWSLQFFTLRNRVPLLCSQQSPCVVGWQVVCVSACSFFRDHCWGTKAVVRLFQHPPVSLICAVSPLSLELTLMCHLLLLLLLLLSHFSRVRLCVTP